MSNHFNLNLSKYISHNKIFIVGSTKVGKTLFANQYLNYKNNERRQHESIFAQDPTYQILNHVNIYIFCL